VARACRATLGEHGFRLFRGVAFASFLRGEALIERDVDGLAVAEEPVVLRFNEIEGVGEKFGRLAESSAIELALDAVFKGGIERDGHGGIVTLGLGWGESRVAPGRRGGVERGCAGG